MKKITENQLNKEFKKRGIDLNDKQISQFVRLHELLVTYNEEYDLSRLKSNKDIIEKHFIDSLYFTRYIDMPKSLLDIGTGPGFPGIPLKIAFPDTHVILGEPRHKRVTFMEMVIKDLGLEKVEVYPHLVTDKSFFDVEAVVTRALEDAEGTLTRVSHFLPAGGRVFFMKGPGAEDDLKALSKENLDRYDLEQNRSYTLRDDNDRCLLVFQKKSDTPAKLFPIMKNIEETAGQAITSGDNKTYKALKKLTTSEGIRKNRQTLASGHRIVKEIFENKLKEVNTCIIPDGYREEDPDMLRYFDELIKNKKFLVLKKGLYNDLDIFGTMGPIASIEAPELQQWEVTDNKGLTLMIPFQDPSNVGSVIRSAVGFGVARIVLLKEAANPYHPRALRTSSGSVFNAPLFRGPSIRDLADSDLPVPLVTLDRSGSDLGGFTFPEDCILLPGIEGPGLPDSLKSNAVSIPLDGPVESLNAAVAASVALFAWRQGQ